jgi:hypothetical protein
VGISPVVQIRRPARAANRSRVVDLEHAQSAR